MILVLVLLAVSGLAVTLAPQLVASLWPGLAAVVQAAGDPAAAPQPAARLQPAKRDLLVAEVAGAWEQGDWNLAAQSLAVLAAAEPQDALWTERLCQARVNLGFALLGQARLAEAAAQFELALGARPASGEALAGRELAATLVVPAPSEAAAPASAPAEAPAADPTCPTPCPPVCPAPVVVCPTVCPPPVRVVAPVCPQVVAPVCPAPVVVAPVCPQVVVRACPPASVVVCDP